MQTSLVLALAQAGYCGLFGLLGLLMRRSLFVGVAYIFFFEGILASIDTVARKLTIMYYYRVLILRWLQPPRGGDAVVDHSGKGARCPNVRFDAGCREHNPCSPRRDRLHRQRIPHEDARRKLRTGE